MGIVSSLLFAISYIQAARKAAHDGSCPGGSYPCAACVPFMSAAAVLDIIRDGSAGPATCRPARLYLHDQVCRSGCTGESRDDHARRQDDKVRELRRYVREAGEPGARLRQEFGEWVLIEHREMVS